MKYVSLDIETTGLNAETDDIIEIGAIVEDTGLKLDKDKCPSFHLYIDKDVYSGNLYALAMNGKIFQKIVDLKKQKSPTVVVKEEVIPKFKQFLTDNGIEKMIPAGKNFGSFDLQFIKRLPGFDQIRTHHRTLDPAMLYLNFKEDLEPLDLATCKKRADLNGVVNHEALDDAWDVIQLLRRFY